MQTYRRLGRSFDASSEPAGQERRSAHQESRGPSGFNRRARRHSDDRRRDPLPFGQPGGRDNVRPSRQRRSSGRALAPIPTSLLAFNRGCPNGRKRRTKRTDGRLRDGVGASLLRLSFRLPLRGRGCFIVDMTESRKTLRNFRSSHTDRLDAISGLAAPLAHQAPSVCAAMIVVDGERTFANRNQLGQALPNLSADEAMRSLETGEPAIATSNSGDMTKTKRAGMGLSISGSIIEARYRKIWVAPDSGGGTIFNFTLPLRESDSLHD